MGSDLTRYFYFSLPLLGSVYLEANSVVKTTDFCQMEWEDGELFLSLGRMYVIYTPPNWVATQRHLIALRKEDFDNDDDDFDYA
ncbi:hypothetical protein [Desulfovibrio oxyclinae]|uniref:hypothetical protein n=1 Tax=Desulfovibrio oxyclinae TaxID=63560 RepID=UPI00037465D0|nr:hypothetical protein [Desulfovibrio oxyclinae]